MEKDKIKQFWNAHPCDLPLKDKKYFDKTFFDKVTQNRYSTQSHLLRIGKFDKFYGKKVLEIGCGIGTDGAQFAKNGAIYTGLDLSEVAIEIAKKRFEIYGLEGEFVVGDAEKLPFLKDSFECVYSHGVLHHTPSIEKAIKEIHRVLKPGGELILMLYHKHSYEYYVNTMLFRRFLVLVISSDTLFKILKKITGKKMIEFAQHRDNFLKMGLHYLNPNIFINYVPDGVNCSLAKVFTIKEVKELLRNFVSVKFKIRHFLYLFPGIPLKPVWLRELIGKFIGFFLYIYAKKPK